DTIEGDQVPVPKARFLGELYNLLGEKGRVRAEFEKARAHFEKQVAEQPEHAPSHLALGEIYARLGRRDDALREGLRATTILPPSRDAIIGPKLQVSLAGIYMMVGEKEKSLDLLEQLIGKPVVSTPAELGLDPFWDPLRKEPRFQKILERGDTR
ncbi:MAG: hypothetical protein M3O82_06720, partial [Verrucomicrobiota bacterium]|nr:hypothetical protein [Verrucomicrobiota bacterium]